MAAVERKDTFHVFRFRRLVGEFLDKGLAFETEHRIPCFSNPIVVIGFPLKPAPGSVKSFSCRLACNCAAFSRARPGRSGRPTAPDVRVDDVGETKTLGVRELDVGIDVVGAWINDAPLPSVPQPNTYAAQPRS